MIRRHAAWWGGTLLAIAYVVVYAWARDVPHPGWPGWWSYWDQSWYLRSAEAFAHGDLSAASHWYAPGYALLGAPFVAAGLGGHPFALVDLLCLLGTYACFVSVAARCAVSAPWAALLFCATTLSNQQIFRQWVIPWNTSPVALLTWGVLALAGRGRPLLMGVLVGLVPWFRAADIGPAALCLLVALSSDGRPWRALSRAGMGVLSATAPWAALHVAIYGLQSSPYMVHSAGLGFTFDDLGWKSYVILSDPRPWFVDGAGLLRRLPWLALGLAGLAPALWRGGVARALACGLAAHMLLYVSYIDLLPSGLWRYNNVHYFKWALPGYGLLGYLLLRDLSVRPWSRRSSVALAGIVAVAALSCLRIVPRPAGSAEAAKMLILPGPRPLFEATYFGDLTIDDASGKLHNVTDFRAVPDLRGTRVIALRRAFAGALTAASPPERFAEAIDLGLPCWLPFADCKPPTAP